MNWGMKFIPNKTHLHDGKVHLNKVLGYDGPVLFLRHDAGYIKAHTAEYH